MIADICKIDDLLKLLIHFSFRKTDNLSVQINIFNAVVFGIESRSELQQR